MQFDEFLRWVEGQRGFGAAIEVKAPALAARWRGVRGRRRPESTWRSTPFLPNEIVAAKAG